MPKTTGVELGLELGLLMPCHPQGFPVLGWVPHEIGKHPSPYGGPGMRNNGDEQDDFDEQDAFVKAVGKSHPWKLGRKQQLPPAIQ